MVSKAEIEIIEEEKKEINLGNTCPNTIFKYDNEYYLHTRSANYHSRIIPCVNLHTGIIVNLSFDVEIFTPKKVKFIIEE